MILKQEYSLNKNKKTYLTILAYVYHLVAVSLFTASALFCFQLISIVLLEANKNKLTIGCFIKCIEFQKFI